MATAQPARVEAMILIGATTYPGAGADDHARRARQSDEREARAVGALQHTRGTLRQTTSPPSLGVAFSDELGERDQHNVSRQSEIGRDHARRGQA
jgi:hypothetical protein